MLTGSTGGMPEIGRGTLMFLCVCAPWFAAMLSRHGLPFWIELIGDNYVHRAQRTSRRSRHVRLLSAASRRRHVPWSGLWRRQADDRPLAALDRPAWGDPSPTGGAVPVLVPCRFRRRDPGQHQVPPLSCRRYRLWRSWPDCSSMSCAAGSAARERPDARRFCSSGVPNHVPVRSRSGELSGADWLAVQL